jgi:mRNA-degrading endonuclease RelE of RelBE toxin-antitoxin system
MGAWWLVAALHDLHWIRCGHYRILYQIEEARLVVVVVNVGN